MYFSNASRDGETCPGFLLGDGMSEKRIHAGQAIFRLIDAGMSRDAAAAIIEKLPKSYRRISGSLYAFVKVTELDKFRNGNSSLNLETQ